MHSMRASQIKKIVFYVVFIFIATSVFVLTNSYAHVNDPLSNQEIDKIVSLVRGQAQATKRELRKSPDGKKYSKEILLVERHYQKNAPQDQRRADIYTYDYETNELIESLVDLNSSEVLATSRQQGVQLPLTKSELRRVKRIVFEDDEERQILENEYQRITSRKLKNFSELYFKAIIFTADSLPKLVNEESKQCGLHRCAQLMLYTGENVVFEITPIVNLSEGVVTQRIGF